MYTCVRDVDYASLNHFFLLDFKTVPKVWYLFHVIACYTLRHGNMVHNNRTNLTLKFNGPIVVYVRIVLGHY